MRARLTVNDRLQLLRTLAGCGVARWSILAERSKQAELSQHQAGVIGRLHCCLHSAQEVSSHTQAADDMLTKCLTAALHDLTSIGSKLLLPLDN